MQKQAPNVWKCRGRPVACDPPLVMGIVNVTPDSFYPASRMGAPERAVAHGLRLAAEGADILDVGGESTRPGASPVSPEEEIGRVVPVIRALAAALPDTLLSVDTRHAAVAKAALEAGAHILNDVAGCDPDAGMWELVAESGAGYVLTHARGTPQTMDSLTDYADVVAEVRAALRVATERLAALGADPAQIVWDPGLGFAKTHADSWRLLGATARLAAGGRPVLIGASRKRFLGGEDAAARGPASVGAALWAAAQGACAVRVHDVAETVQALRAFRRAKEAADV